uniref:Uncharacterized protein n=1 Tax=Panagrolaimus davidi TaxID=227884 RepID=A0A914PPJ0_9BILA
MPGFLAELESFNRNNDEKNNIATELSVALDCEIEYIPFVDHFQCKETIATIYRKLGRQSGLMNFGITLSRKENGFAVSKNDDEVGILYCKDEEACNIM